MSTITVSAGETVSGITISAFVSAAVESGGVLEDSTILSGGGASIGIGADAARLVVSGGILLDDGNIIDTEVIDSGYFSVSDGTAENTVVSGGMMVVEDGERHLSAVARNTTVEAGGTLMAEIAFVSATTVKADAVMYSVGTAAGVTVSRGGALIAQDGTVTGATIGSGGVGFAGNAAVAGVIEAGSTFVVSASIGPYGLAQTSANLSGLSADAGATVIVAGGAVETGLTLLPGASIQHAGVTVTSNTEGGPRLISATNFTSGALLGNGKTEAVYAGGIASATIIGSGGAQYVVSGGSAADTVVQGGTQTIFADASATDTTISSGGTAVVSGDLAGVQVFSGGVLSAEGFDFNAGHLVTGAIVHSGGFLSDAGVVVGAQILQGATLFAAEGGSAANTVIEQGGVMLLDGGAATDTTVLAGGELFAPSFYYTSLSGVTVSSGGVFILSAAIVQDVTVESGGTLYLLNGPGTSGITVDPGVTIVRPEAFIISAAAPSYRDTALVSAANLLSGQIIATGGQETVSSGGVAIDTTVSASIFSYQSPAQYVEAGGSSFATFVLSAGEQLISGTSTDSAVAVKTVVGDGGYVSIDSGGFALSATLEAGGQMNIEGGFAKNLLFQPGGALVLGALQGSGTTGTATLNSSDLLTVSVDGQHYSIQLVGDYAGDTFTVKPNPYQGAFVFLSATAATDLVPAAARPLDTPLQAMAGMAAGQNPQLMLIEGAAHQPAGPGEANPLEFPDR